MIWGIASFAILVITVIVTVRAMQDQRKKGKGGFTSFVVGCFAGGFFGAFLFVILGVVAIFAN